MKTINLQGKEYAPVSARLEQFHKDHKNSSITTETTFTEGHVVVKATVSIEERKFNGHAYGKTQGTKAFEKLETTAVGRALAFAGYLAGGEIASYDEMKEFVSNDVPDVPEINLKDALLSVSVATDVEDLESRFKKLPEQLRKDEEVIAKCKEVKEELEEKES